MQPRETSEASIPDVPILIFFIGKSVLDSAASAGGGGLVEDRGLEPLTSCLQSRRSPN